MDPDFKQKLTDEQRWIAVRMHTEGHSFPEISKYILDTWGIEYKANSVLALTRQKKYSEFINKSKEEYLKKIKDVPIANKRIRIDDLENVRKKIMVELNRNNCDTKAMREEFRQLVRTLNDVIINAREEMEKKPNLIPGILLGDFSDKSDDELISERDEILRQAEKLIAGTSSQTGGHPEGTAFEDPAEPS